MSRYYKLLASDAPKIKQKQEKNFGVCSNMGDYHNAQEDAALWQEYDDNVLDSLTPEDIGQRLWTSYHVLNNDFSTTYPNHNSGTTASTTIIKGNDLITATLADTIAYVVVWGPDNTVLGVKRLTQRTHSPDLPEEKQRINQILTDHPKTPLTVVGGRIILKSRNNHEMTINVSRAIGDRDFQPAIIADADIHITSIPRILAELKIINNVEKIQIITASDGFTEHVPRGRKLPDSNQKDEKRMHEVFLRRSLKKLTSFDEQSIATQLTEEAIKSGSKDNVTVVVQTIMRVGESVTCMGMNAVFDGHDGHDGKVAANYSVSHLSGVLDTLFRMSSDEYNEHPYRYKNSNHHQLFCIDDAMPVHNVTTIIPTNTNNASALQVASMFSDKNKRSTRIKTSCSSLMLKYLSKEFFALLTVAFLIATICALLIGICGVVGLPCTGVGAGISLGVGLISAVGLGYLMFKSVYPFVLGCFDNQSDDAEKRSNSYQII